MNVYKITCIKLKTVTCFWYTLFKNVLFWKLRHKCIYCILNELYFPPSFLKMVLYYTQPGGIGIMCKNLGQERVKMNEKLSHAMAGITGRKYS